MQKLKRNIKNIVNNIYIQHLFIIAGMGFSFLVLDVFLRYFSNQYVDLYKFTHASPLFFSVSWIFIFIMILYLFCKKIRMILYVFTCSCFNILTLTQILYMKSLNRFFGLSDIFLAKEGADYLSYALSKIDMFTVILIMTSIISMFITLIMIKYSSEFKRNYSYYLLVVPLGILLFSNFRYFAIERLGEEADKTTWEAAFNVKNIYIDFNNQNKNMEVAGLYEQTFKNSYLYIKDVLNTRKDEINKELDELIGDEELSIKNKYTGMFKGKNLIFILLESVDSWLVDEKVMPTLSTLMKEGWNFTNRYAPTFGGGQTINSEFAANTGLYAINNSKAIYNFDTNYYPYSVANMFKSNGYSTYSIHANTAKFYNRSLFHETLGYEGHYALSDMTELDSSYDYFLDSSLVKNDEVLDLIIRDEKFMSFITTYSPHLPYNNENINCSKNLYNLDNKKLGSELSCIYNLARDTDEFLRILIEELDNRKVLDDTVLVLFSDHYMYGYSDINEIYDYKGVDNINLVQNVPFVIWNSEIKSKKIKTIMDTADITPTVLNLFGFTYPTNYFNGTDVFSDKHENFVYFDDTTFYDGNLYYDGKNKIDDSKEDYVKEILTKINTKIDTNNKIISGDYFRYIRKKTD